VVEVDAVLFSEAFCKAAADLVEETLLTLYAPNGLDTVLLPLRRRGYVGIEIRGLRKAKVADEIWKASELEEWECRQGLLESQGVCIWLQS